MDEREFSVQPLAVIRPLQGLVRLYNKNTPLSGRVCARTHHFLIPRVRVFSSPSHVAL